MSNELDFKERGCVLQFPMEKMAHELTIPKKKSKARYKELLQQKKKGLVEYIEKGVDRRNHVLAFANTYRSVTAKECKNFYKKNPKDFNEEKLELLVVSAIFGVFACLLMGIGFMAASDTTNKWWEIVAGVLLFGTGGVSLCTSGLLLKCWWDMKRKGAENWKASPDDFLRVFERDKNLKKLWSKKGDADVDLSKKSYKKKPEEIQTINAYYQTRRWLRQWSGEDEEQLSEVEWKTLYAIAKKYGKYLTPLAPCQKPRNNPI